MQIQSLFSPSHSEQLGCLQYRAWQIAYKGLLPDEILETETEKRVIEKWRLILAQGEDWLKRLNLQGKDMMDGTKVADARTKWQVLLMSAVEEVLDNHHTFKIT